MLDVVSRVQLFVTPRTVCSSPGSSVYRILQARILEWVAISFSCSVLLKSDLRGCGWLEALSMSTERAQFKKKKVI